MTSTPGSTRRRAKTGPLRTEMRKKAQSMPTRVAGGTMTATTAPALRESMPTPRVMLVTAAITAIDATTQIIAMPRRHHHGRSGLWNMFSKMPIAVERPADDVQMNAPMLTGAITAVWLTAPETRPPTGPGDALRIGPSSSSPFSWSRCITIPARAARGTRLRNASKAIALAATSA